MGCLSIRVENSERARRRRRRQKERRNDCEKQTGVETVVEVVVVSSVDGVQVMSVATQTWEIREASVNWETETVWEASSEDDSSAVVVA